MAYLQFSLGQLQQLLPICHANHRFGLLCIYSKDSAEFIGRNNIQLVACVGKGVPRPLKVQSPTVDHLHCFQVFSCLFPRWCSSTAQNFRENLKLYMYNTKIWKHLKRAIFV